MAVIDTNWNPTHRDLRIFGLVSAGIVAVMLVFSYMPSTWLADLLGNLLSWKFMGFFAITAAIGTALVPAQLRPFGIGAAIILGALSLLTRSGTLIWDRPLLLVIGAGMAALSLLRPGAIRGLYLAAMVSVFPIGLVMGPVIMGAMFFLIFTPVAFVFRLIGRDAMNRKFDPQAATYWIPHKPVESVNRYFRQF
jgi:MFS family permease